MRKTAKSSTPRWWTRNSLVAGSRSFLPHVLAECRTKQIDNANKAERPKGAKAQAAGVGPRGH
jgi:hypothetical protein